VSATSHPVDDEVPAAEQRTRRRIRSIIAVFIATTAAGLLAGSVVVAIAGVGVGEWFIGLGQPETNERPHLKAIPVSKDACPYVVAMHKAANAFESQTPAFELVPEGRGQVIRWRPAVSHAADVLDVTVAAGIPHVPPLVQAYLMTVRVDIERERELALPAKDAGAFLSEVMLGSASTDVQRAFGFAGDLVGHACSVELGADGA
jgi:hypothetical protein